MKKLSIAIMAILFASAVFSGTALASWSFDITTDYAAGDSQATFDLNLNVTDTPIELGNYEFTFSYDDAELAYNSYTHNLFPGFMEFAGAAQGENGTVSNFMGFAFMGNATVDAGDYTLGTFTFDVTNSVLDETTDFNFLYSDNMFTFWVDGEPYNSEALIQSVADSHFTDIGSAAAVPIPGAVWLLGSGIVSMVCVRRRKS